MVGMQRTVILYGAIAFVVNTSLKMVISGTFKSLVRQSIEGVMSKVLLPKRSIAVSVKQASEKRQSGMLAFSAVGLLIGEKEVCRSTCRKSLPCTL